LEKNFGGGGGGETDEREGGLSKIGSEDVEGDAVGGSKRPNMFE